jgi:hypothetical protein
LIKIKAKFTLPPTEKGGRKIPILSGYRLNHVITYKENSKDFVATSIRDVNFEGLKY